jgi:hypothetical protein
VRILLAREFVSQERRLYIGRGDELEVLLQQYHSWLVMCYIKISRSFFPKVGGFFAERKILVREAETAGSLDVLHFDNLVPFKDNS